MSGDLRSPWRVGADSATRLADVFSYCNNTFCHRKETPPRNYPRDGSGSGETSLSHRAVAGGTVVRPNTASHYGDTTVIDAT